MTSLARLVIRWSYCFKEKAEIYTNQTVVLSQQEERAFKDIIYTYVHTKVHVGCERFRFNDDDQAKNVLFGGFIIASIHRYTKLRRRKLSVTPTQTLTSEVF